ncbi:MAG TPA: ClpX C4-type zinc finger protein [Jatrophihabitans sp.]|nr:ClpX C4-type zinc finger protein [Jatrophihabitans sp.]
MPTVADPVIHCSFCAKEESAAGKVIAGPGVYICDGCVDTCVSILRADRESGGAPAQLPPWDSMTDAALLDLLPRVARVAEQVEASLRQWVLRARDRGITWSRIGGALGMTRQSAWGRFSGEE